MKHVHGVVVEFGRGGVEWGFLREDNCHNSRDTYVHRKDFSPGVHSISRGERVQWIEVLCDRGLKAVALELETPPAQELSVADRGAKLSR
jgi:hypothetical protein